MKVSFGTDPGLTVWSHAIWFATGGWAWAELVSLIAPHAPAPGAKGGCPPFAVETMLRIHFLQQWFNLSDPAMEEALYDMALFREFAGLDAGDAADLRRAQRVEHDRLVDAVDELRAEVLGDDAHHRFLDRAVVLAGVTAHHLLDQL